MNQGRCCTLSMILCFCMANVATTAQERDPREVKSAPRDATSAILLSDEVVLAAGSAGEQDCTEFGGTDSSFGSSGFDGNRYRANVYRVEFPDAQLREISVQLQIPVGELVELSFSVHAAPSTEDIPTYMRAMPHITKTVVGTGLPTFYSSGLIPLSGLPLVQGNDYLIGVAWSNTSVFFFRDDEQYPRLEEIEPFIHGTIIGSVVLFEGPPIAEAFETTVFSLGAYSFELCFDAVEGACCTPGVGCESQFKAECTTPGGFFFGQRTLCEDIDCAFGGCCTACGGCFEEYALEACKKSGSVWQGRGVTCPANPSELCEPVTGACCDRATCSETCRAFCRGTYLGDNTSCEPNMCQGACCVSGFGCGDLSLPACQSLGGTFKGSGTTCDGLLGTGFECGGACCVEFLGSRLCIDVRERDVCTAEQGLIDPVYLGDALSCFDEDNEIAPALCVDGIQHGACCLPNGDCVVTISDACDPESFSAGLTCDAVACTSCCVGGTCRRYPSEAACMAVGTVSGKPSCVPDVCSLATGACCTDGAAPICTSDIIERDCTALSGRFEEGLDCTTGCLSPFGACCRPNGTCSDFVTESECTVFGGASTAGEKCSTMIPQCPILGACCDPEGTCSIMLQDVCEAMGTGHAFSGEGTTCRARTCLTGACCGTDDLCKEATLTGCAAEDGDYRGDGTPCDSLIFCGTVVGACCLNNGCQMLLPQACNDLGGSFQGTDAICMDTDVCALGSCCVGGTTCTDNLFPAECVALGGVQSLGLTCLGGACDPMGACCRNGACTIETEANCGFGSVYEGDGTTCTEGRCTLGACCTRGACTNVIPSGCDASDPDTEFFDAVLCNTQPCDPFGACCLRDGSCRDDEFESNCMLDRGELPADRSCVSITCNPVGACCLGSASGHQCVDDQTLNQCESMGGVYQGDASDCPAGPCGACCRLQGLCEDSLTSTSCDGAFDTIQSGFLCSQVAACEPRGACCTSTGCLENVSQDTCETVEGGIYDGDGTLCRADLCDVGACCIPGIPGTCDELTLQACEGVDGVYLGAGLLCVDSNCTRGSCCTSLGECLADVVVTQCGDPADFRSGLPSCMFPACEPRGACCLDQTCSVTTNLECTGVYAGDGTDCAQIDLCVDGACCLPGGSCEVHTRLSCERALGTYTGEMLACVTHRCAEILSSDPTNCIIDARQPFEPDGTISDGYRLIELSFNQDMTGAVSTDFTVSVFPLAVTPPSITNALVGADPSVVTLELSGPIEPGLWTCFTLDVSGTQVCLGSAPGDVDGNGTAEAADIAAMVNCVNDSVMGAACEVNSCDADRSGACGPADILRVIDLLGGAQNYVSFAPAVLPECPSLP